MKYQSQDFQGLTPAIDPRRSNQLFALGGKNYVLDSFGPKSAFANRYLTPYPIGRPEYVEGFRLRLRTGDKVFTMTADSIIEWDEGSGGWRILYHYPSIAIQPYRWTAGFLNGLMFFCHPAVGILAYDVEKDITLPLVSPGTPDQPLAITICNGRLVVIDELFMTWSGPGDGTNFIPQLGGAGTQRINTRIPGFPIMITSYTRGTLIWTTGGVMRSEFTGDVEVFRHRALVTEYRPINSFCLFKLDDDTVGILDERGFFVSKGEAPTPMTPLFNEFLIDYLQKYDLKFGINVRVEWDDLQRRVYLSHSLSDYEPKFERAFVLYTSLDKWGKFDEPHYGIFPLLVNDSSRADDYFGFCDETGRIRYWEHTASREVLPVDPLLNSYYPVIQAASVKEITSNSVVLSSSFTVNTHNDILITQRAGYYPFGGTSPANLELTGLDSSVQLGLIRVDADNGYDRLLEVTNVFVGNVVSGNEFVVTDDFNLIPDGIEDEDFNIVVGAEDFGIDDSNYVNHGLRIIGTMDGSTSFLAGTPELIRFDKAGRHFSTSVTGIWHIVELSATEIGEAYHVRALELSAIDGGSLT